MVYSSIWKDTYYTTSQSPFNYTIRLDGNVIFAGRAYAYPEADSVRVKVNTICENYLSQNELTQDDFFDPSDVSAVTENPTLIRYFELWNEDTNTLAETYSFLDCWDYDYNYTIYPIAKLSNPIDDVVVPWMSQFETRIYARLTDSEGKWVFAIDLNEVKANAAASEPYQRVFFYLSSGSDDEEGGVFYYNTLTNHLTFGSDYGGSQHQYNVYTEFSSNWTDSANYPMACGLHCRRFGDMLYFYSDEPWEYGYLQWEDEYGTETKDVDTTEGLSISPTSSSLLLITQPHTFEAKTIVRPVDEGDPRITKNCIDYVLYYVNARGGWDQFVIQGATTKKDSITAYSTDRAYNNNTMEFEQMRNVTEIQTTYELNTHYLTDEQSANLAQNLLGSNMVYLHNLRNGDVKPVIIQDKQVTYQTYQTNNKRLAQYKITVAESQIKHRRH